MHWHGFNGGDTVVKLLETVTDKDGRYHLPAWGPEPIPSYVPWDASQNPVYPRIVLFKSGYYTNEVSNDDFFSGGIPRAWTTKSQWNGKTIGLKKFKGSLKEYSAQVEFFLGLAGADAQCVLKSQVPRAVAVGIKEGERLTQLGIRNALPRLLDIDESGDPACEALKKSIREYLK